MSQIAEPTSTATMNPSWPARLPFYYGWVHVLLAAIAMTATLPGRTYGFGLIKIPLCQELGIDSVRFNDLNFWAVVIGSVCVPPMGWLIDRLGVRIVLVLVTVLLGGSVIAMSRAADELEVAIGLTVIRGLGQGALSVVAIALVGKWFRRRSGIAMGVFSVLLSLGFGPSIQLLGKTINASGWRTGWEGMGWVLVLGLAPIGWLFARRSPEACGVKPDEAVEETDSAPSMTLRETLLTPSFWVYSLCSATFLLTFSAMTLDNQSLLDERGLDGKDLNYKLLALLMYTGLPSNLLAGWLARYISLGKILGAGIIIQAASLAFFPFVATVADARIYALILGASSGSVTVAFFAIYGHHYGRKHLGKIQAAAQLMTVLSSAVGPVLLERWRREVGSSDPFFFTFAAITLILGIASWFVRPPNLKKDN
jgi:MFS family permease